MLESSKIYPSFIRKRGTRFKALLALSLVCFFWGTTWIASKEGVTYMPVLQLVSIRQLLGGIVYILFFMTKARVLPRGNEWWPILVLCFLNFILSNALSTWGVKYISAGLGSIIGAIFPLWIVIIGLFNSKSKIPLQAITGLLLGFGGVCIIFYEHLHDFFNAEFRLGIFLSVAATWSWAFGTIYTKHQAREFNPYLSLGWQMIISGSLLFVVSEISGTAIPYSQIPWQAWSAIAYLVIFGSVISFVAYLYALQHLPTGQVSIYAYINPVVAVIFGSIFFEDRLTAFIILGGAVTLYGVYLVNQVYNKMKLSKGISADQASSQ